MTAGTAVSCHMTIKLLENEPIARRRSRVGGAILFPAHRQMLFGFVEHYFNRPAASIPSNHIFDGDCRRMC